MATTNKKINVTTLDFDDIKKNLKTYLSGQTEFQDYDFEGSAMSVLLDVLAYILTIMLFTITLLSMRCFWIQQESVIV